jgi:hypothetical protein
MVEEPEEIDVSSSTKRKLIGESGISSNKIRFGQSYVNMIGREASTNGGL